MHITRLAIVGCGLIGTSVALAARRAWPGLHILGVDRGDTIRREAVIGAVDAGATSIRAVGEADLVVLATPVNVILDSLPAIARVVPRGVLVTDVGSTKRRIVAAARAAGVTAFVGGHPMAGDARHGPEAARAGLFDDRPWILVRGTAPADGLAAVGEFIEQLGARVVVHDDEGGAHDRLMAAVSHLPQVAASVLMQVAGEAAGERGLVLAGAGLADTTRLASSAASVWAGILQTNAEEVRPLLITLADELRHVAGRLDDPASLERLFETAQRWRQRLDHKV